MNMFLGLTVLLLSLLTGDAVHRGDFGMAVFLGLISTQITIFISQT